MQLHELIDREDPRCLYCNANVDCHLSSEWISKGTSLRNDVESIVCQKCKEVFYIHSWQGDDGHTEYSGFTFTCKDLSIFFNYIESYFDISKNGKKKEHITTIPSFTIDFSHKDKLYEKLKTYIVFS
jgi:hypothetical protein